MNILKDFQIRQFQETDIDAVIKINRECLPENYPSFFFMSIYYKYPKSFLISIHNGTPCGYCMWRAEKGLSNFALRWTKKAHLVSIAVLEPYRRQGIGETILLKGMQYMKEDYKASEFILEVRVSNTNAIALYKKHGYTIIKTLDGYYRDGEDAYMMARRI